MGWQEDDLPLFGCIEDIMIIQNSVMFQVSMLATVIIIKNTKIIAFIKNRYSDIQH